jgi:gas vesicle protein
MVKKTLKKGENNRKTKKHGGWMGESIYRKVHQLVRGKKSTGHMIKEIEDEINEISTLCASGANNLKDVQPRIEKVKEKIQQSALDETKKKELMDKIICKLPKTTKFKFIKKADSNIVELERSIPPLP